MKMEASAAALALISAPPEIHGKIAIGLAGYGCLMPAIWPGWMRRVRQVADYLIAGRKLPCWILTGTIMAGCIGTGVFIQTAYRI